jgi:hypothetical protein
MEQNNMFVTYADGDWQYKAGFLNSSGSFGVLSCQKGSDIWSEMDLVPPTTSALDAQKALDTYAQMHKWQPVSETLDSVNDLPETALENPESESKVPETVSEPKETEQSETTPTGWDNASGEEEHPEKNEALEVPDDVDGEPLTLHGTEFEQIIGTADGVLNKLVSMLHEKKQREGEMTIKVGFEDADGLGNFIFSGAVSGKINYTVKPQKVISDAVPLKFDNAGNPVLPADRERQLSFADMQEPSALVTAGESGIVQSVQLDPCSKANCPFYDMERENSCQGRDEFEQCPGCVKDAVNNQHCRNADLLDVYNKLIQE